MLPSSLFHLYCICVYACVCVCNALADAVGQRTFKTPEWISDTTESAIELKSGRKGRGVCRYTFSVWVSVPSSWETSFPGRAKGYEWHLWLWRTRISRYETRCFTRRRWTTPPASSSGRTENLYQHASDIPHNNVGSSSKFFDNRCEASRPFQQLAIFFGSLAFYTSVVRRRVGQSGQPILSPHESPPRLLTSILT